MREEFRIPAAKWPEVAELVKEILAAGQEAGTSMHDERESVGAKRIAEIATHAWKAYAKMTDAETKEAKAEYRSVHRHIEGILQALKEMGVEIQDHTGAPFDYGLPLKVITSQPMTGLKKERVTETFKPTIYWQGQIIQTGEVVIAIPA